jgi:hypothetical protein
MKFYVNNQKRKRIAAVVIAILLIVGLAFLTKAIFQKISSSTISDNRVNVSDAKKSKLVNKDFTFPLKNDKGEEVGKIKYFIESVELRDEIIVKGQRATSVKGRTFLIVNLKLSNEFDKSVDINTKDYIRLSVNNNDQEWLAPDIHNDPVNVQAISTKFTRVGFPINDTDKNLKLRIGEVKGDKTVVDIKFN